MADNITHGLAAALLAQAGFQQRYGAIATVALVVGSELPDIDALFKLAGPVAGFVHHRGITHSILGGLVLALLGAAGFWSVRRTQPYWRLVWLVYIGVLLHIGMDYLTSYGTQIFLPFNARHYTSDTVFIVDYCYTAIMITGLLLVRMVRQQFQTHYQATACAWLLAGAVCWVAAPHLAGHTLGWLTWPQLGLWLTLGSAGLLAGLAHWRTHHPPWQPPYGTRGVLWLLCGLGLWLCTPYAVPRSLVLMAQQAAGRHFMTWAAIVLCGAWLSKHWQARRAVVFGRLGIGALATYVALCGLSNEVVKRHMAQALGPQMNLVRRLSALPLPGGGAFHWRAIAETDTTYLVSRVSLMPRTITQPQSIAKGTDNQVIRDPSRYRLVQVFWDFARFPVIDYRELSTETVVRYADLRFIGDGRDRSWFDLTVRLDPAGQVRVIEFLNRVFLPHHPDFYVPSTGW